MKCEKCEAPLAVEALYCHRCATPTAVTVRIAPRKDRPEDGLIGTRLKDRYEVLEKLGDGGMGEVYRAIDRDFNDDEVAVKTLLGTAGSPKAITELKKEADIQKDLRHDNIVVFRYFEHDKARGLHFIVMECVHGHDLNKRLELQNGFGLSVDEVLHYAAQICAAVALNLSAFDQRIMVIVSGGLQSTQTVFVPPCPGRIQEILAKSR